jgi:hypothetical protein
MDDDTIAAEAKLTEQASRIEHLSEQLSQLAEFAEVESQRHDRLATDTVQQYKSRMAARDLHAEIVLRPMPTSLPEALNQAQADDVLTVAEKLVARSTPDWYSLRPQVQEAMSRNPDWLRGAESDPAAAAARIANLASVERSARTRRSEKMAAQTMSGASSRAPAMSDEQAAWAKIAGAGSSSYAALRSRDQ